MNTKVMRKLFLCLSVIGMILTGCSKNDDEDNGENEGKLPDLPALPDPDDVCSAMDDLNFMSYCYDKVDVNKDGKVSVNEANAVKEMKMSGLNIKNLIGIERFPNLQTLLYTGAGEIDLRYNEELIEVDFSKSATTKIDLSRCKKLASFNANSSKSLITVIFSDDIETIEYHTTAFYDCTNLSSITFPKNLTLNTVDIFFRCTNLTNITFSQKVETINGSIWDCPNLVNLTFPESLISVGQYAFERCNLKSVTCYSTTPPIIEDRSFMSYLAILFVPQNSLQAYKDSDWAKVFKDIQPIK